MNTDRRHELQHNVLADYLTRINHSIEPHSKLIAAVVGVAIVGSLGWIFYQSNVSGQRSDATLQLVLAAGEGDAEVLSMVGEQYSQTTAGSWARLYQADELMSRGMRVLYTDRAEATELFTSAENAYSQALSTSKDKVLDSRAHFGLARIAESSGNAEKAIEEYRKTMAANESEAMVEVAQQRIDSLSRPDTKEFLAWFGEQNFTPSDPALPPSLPGSNMLPDLPDLNLPPLDLPDLGDEGAAAKAEIGAMKLGGTADEEPAGAEALALPDSGLEMPAKVDGAEPAAAAEKTEAAPETKPEAETKPAPETKPEAEAKPEAETKPAVETPPATESAPAAEAVEKAEASKEDVIEQVEKAASAENESP